MEAGGVSHRLFFPIVLHVPTHRPWRAIRSAAREGLGLFLGGFAPSGITGFVKGLVI
jgi:hypothetical protein